eukprot:CAMPEP_0203650684 /NCGR_PEP_ID=MMETSP0088-20131115/25380_1 /ASSEMBLY_ACC=CAM_ASM_001087 /TAXON_ID=426623 /ORGANISM="Chaetoceros affinis, Strain CCMP159" /LENGTH=74 /DNA_ID=CAMNT_0050509559 /DNA_START=206 /DNA_END=430 /DNA_ORIENTATION=-
MITGETMNRTTETHDKRRNKDAPLSLSSKSDSVLAVFVFVFALVAAFAVPRAKEAVNTSSANGLAALPKFCRQL